MRPSVLVIDDSPATLQSVRTAVADLCEVETITPGRLCARLVTAPPCAIVLGPRVRLERSMIPAGTPTLRLAGEETAGEGEVIRSGRALRRRIARLLARAAPAVDEIDPRLRAPWVSTETATVLTQACRSPFPLLLFGPPGAGAHALARLVHAGFGGGVFLAACGRSFALPPALGPDEPGRGTLVLDHLERLDDAAQERLLSLIVPPELMLVHERLRLRLIAVAQLDPADLLEAGFSVELYHRLSVLLAPLVPLQDRLADVAPLARLIARDLCAVLHRPNVSFTRSALDRLCNSVWYGDVAELEAVIARTLALRDGDLIRAEDLCFDSAPAATAPGAPAAAALHGAQLELIVQELAHEIKNPLATIKVFAQRLDRLLAGHEDERALAQLTREAVDDIDAFVENLLQFARLDRPLPARHSLARLVAGAATQLDDDAIHVHSREAGGHPVNVDAMQVEYALVNLLRALTRCGSELRVRFAPPATVLFELVGRDGGLEHKLAGLLDAAEHGAAPLPLGVIIARTVIELNGGALDIEASAVRVSLPAAEDGEEVGNGQSAGPDRG